MPRKMIEKIIIVFTDSETDRRKLKKIQQRIVSEQL